MSGHLTDRDERMWQRRAEERVAEPLRIGAWIRGVGSVIARRQGPGRRTAMAASRPHPCEPA
ncbi:hypothetical protein ACFVZW_04040 [Streptomyces sp. NPDC059567]|uniref:hypothetical protein n=1 Tax=Streptomyces sp. NPDC059567 TaxID=3346867 RepID=UPI003673DB61